MYKFSELPVYVRLPYCRLLRSIPGCAGRSDSQNSDNVNTVYDGFLYEVLNHIISIMTISKEYSVLLTASAALCS